MENHGKEPLTSNYPHHPVLKWLSYRGTPPPPTTSFVDHGWGLFTSKSLQEKQDGKRAMNFDICDIELRHWVENEKY